MYGTEELAYELLGVLNRKYLKIRNILLNLSANIINVLQPGNSVTIEPSESFSFQLDTTVKTMKACANKGIGRYFPNTLYLHS